MLKFNLPTNQLAVSHLMDWSTRQKDRLKICSK